MKRYRVVDWSSRYETGESRRLKRLDWIAVPVDFLGRDYLRLTKREDAVGVFAAFILILEVAAMMPERGVLERNGIPLTAHDLADLTRFPFELFRDALPVLCREPKEGGLGWIAFDEVEGGEEEAKVDLFAVEASPESPETLRGSPGNTVNPHHTLQDPDITLPGQDKTKEGEPAEPPTPPSLSPKKGSRRRGAEYPAVFELSYAPFVEVGKNKDRFAALLAWTKTVEGSRVGTFAFPPVDPDDLRRAARRYIDKKIKDETEQKYIFNASTFFGPQRHWEGYLLPDPEEEKAKAALEAKQRIQEKEKRISERTEVLLDTWRREYGETALPPGFDVFRKEAEREIRGNLDPSVDWIVETKPLERYRKEERKTTFVKVREAFDLLTGRSIEVE